MTEPTTTTPITRATRDNVTRVSATLTRAFADDPVFNWLCPDPDRRAATHNGWFEEITRSLLHHDTIFTTGDGGGATVWVPPGQPMVDDMEAFAERMMGVSPADAERFGTLLGIAEELHPETPDHWYLFFIGVVPDRQGQGIGSALLRDVLDECDDDGVPSYLEATCEENRRLYERHGFEVTDEIHLPDGPTGFAMWREPQT